MIATSDCDGEAQHPGQQVHVCQQVMIVFIGRSSFGNILITSSCHEFHFFGHFSPYINLKLKYYKIYLM